MADAVSRILADLEAGRITAEEAQRLIAEDGGAGGPAAADPVAREPATSKTFEFDFARRRRAVDLGGVGRAVADAVRGAAESVRPGTPLSPTQQEALEGLTGADLKRLVEDGKLLYAHDRVSNRPLRPATEYVAQAAESVRLARERYAEAEARASQKRPQRPPWFAEFAMFMPDEE